MAKDLARLHTRQQKAAFKIETTTGTFEALTATEAVTRFINPKIVYDIEEITRQPLESLSPEEIERGAKGATFTGQHRVYGSGTSGELPYWSNLLLCSGMTESGGVFSLITGATDTASLGCFYAGSRAKYIIGQMFNGVWTMTRGQPTVIDWTGRGKYKAPAADSLSSPTYDSVIAPRGLATFSVGGVTTYRTPSVVFDMGNPLFLREDVSETDTGYRSAEISSDDGRNATITIEPEALPLGTKNWYADFDAGTTVACTLAIGNTAGNTVTIVLPKLQLVNVPDEGSRNGNLTDKLVFRALKNSAAGNDEYTITFS